MSGGRATPTLTDGLTTATTTATPATTATAPTPPPILARCRELVLPEMYVTVQGLPSGIGEMVEFALGWRDTDGTRRPGGGKGLRPALALLSAQAVGASAESAIPGAVAVELVHAFSLVHDDIMDGDEQRRHRQAVWKAFGTGPAVLVGDALLALALDQLARSAPEATRAEALGRLSSVLVELVAGQAEDLAFESRPWTGPDAVTIGEYRAMVQGKTGALLGCASGLGALLGDGTPEQVAALTEMGHHLGLAFQAVDDLLGIWGDPATTGKPVFSDLRRRKKTLPVLAALADRGPGTAARGSALAGLLRGELTEHQLQDAAALIDAAGGREFTSEIAARHLGQALRLITEHAVDGSAVTALTQLGEFAVHRSH